MIIDWFTVSLWVLCWLVGVLFGLVVGYFMGLDKGAKNYGMITKHLQSVWNKRDEADSWLGEIEELADAIRKGSE